MAAGAPRRVFLSHTAELREFVRAAEKAVSRSGDVVLDMDYFSTRDSSPADVSIRTVENADVYVGIIGFRYGSPVRDRPELSYTELEYEAATKIGLPRLVFLLDEETPSPLPVRAIRDIEHGARQERFRRRLREAGLTSSSVTLPDNLETRLYQALNELTASGAALFNAPVLVSHVVSRPELMSRVLPLLPGRHNGAGPMGPTIVLRGAGGFGKTTLAAQVCHEVRDVFPGGVLWVTIGQKVEGAELAAKVNDVTLQLSGQRPTFVDPEQAGHHLGRVLGAQRRLLVIDDVWRPDQLAPFLFGGPSTTRLVTTRIETVAPFGAARVEVDAMTDAEALSLLAGGLGSEPPDLTGLLRSTGRWPVLLRVVNGAIRQWVDRGATIGEAVSRVEANLAAGGPAALDHTRAHAVSTTVEASLQALGATGQEDVDRYLELAAFSDNVDIHQSTLEVFWAHTGGLTAAQVERLCVVLADLSLVQEYRLTPKPRVRVHDVLLGYLRRRVGGARLAAMHRSLLDAHRRRLPADGSTTEWWAMSPAEPYLWAHLARHLREAGRDGGPEAGELQSLVTDLRWIVAKLERLGPAAVDADLELGTGRAPEVLRRRLAQSTHLLDGFDTPHGLGATLLARLEGQSDLERIVTAYAASFAHPRLAPAWPLPDLPHPASLRVLRGQGGPVAALAVGPDGTWLATAGDDRSAQVWSIVDGMPQVDMADQSLRTAAVVAGPDGTWLATAGRDGAVRLWGVADGTLLATLRGHEGAVLALAAERHGRWLVSGGDDGTVRVWSVSEHSLVATLEIHEGSVRALALSPDGSWLASGGDDRAIQLWPADTGSLLFGLAAGCRKLTGHAGAVRALAGSPDGAWLASAGDDRVVRLWNVSDGSSRAVHTGAPGSVCAVAIAPDGSWLASVGEHRDVHLWNAGDGSPRATLTGHTRGLRALGVSPDGSWLASAGQDQTVRLWITAGGATHAALTGHTGPVRAVAVAPDGSWLASAGDDHTVRLWNAADGSIRSELTGHTNSISALVVGRDGSWLASAGRDQTIRIWNVADGSPRRVLTGPTDGVRALGLSPDGMWLASAGHDKMVRLWSTADGSPLGMVIDPGATVTALVVSPDGSWVATGGHDRSIHLWNVADGSHRCTLTGHDFTPKQVGRPFSVTSLAVGPDGSWLASGGHDRTVRLWNTDDGSVRAILTGHGDSVRAVAVSPDGAWLASAAVDQTVRVWNTVTHECATVLRVDGALRACCWLTSPPTRLVVAGDAGLYLLEYRLPAD
ncbi:MAG TPA: NB-ARC domain-containing protein [Candidatus Dormibacteraeota bacterium]